MVPSTPFSRIAVLSGLNARLSKCLGTRLQLNVFSSPAHLFLSLSPRSLLGLMWSIHTVPISASALSPVSDSVSSSIKWTE